MRIREPWSGACERMAARESAECERLRREAGMQKNSGTFFCFFIDSWIWWVRSLFFTRFHFFDLASRWTPTLGGLP